MFPFPSLFIETAFIPQIAEKFKVTTLGLSASQYESTEEEKILKKLCYLHRKYALKPHTGKLQTSFSYFLA